MKFEYWRSTKNSKWYWHLQDSNNRIVADGGEGYENENDLVNELGQIRGGAAMATVTKLDAR